MVLIPLGPRSLKVFLFVRREEAERRVQGWDGGRTGRLFDWRLLLAPLCYPQHSEDEPEGWVSQGHPSQCLLRHGVREIL